MLSTKSSKFDRNKSLSEHSDKNSRIFQLFPNDLTLFTIAPQGEKGGFNNWSEKLRSAPIAKRRTELNGNIGIKLGKVQDRYFVVFDKEKNGELPEIVRQNIRWYCWAMWESPHNGTNYLLEVSERAYRLFDQYKEKVYITDENNHDLEILSSGHALIPPSEIDHSECSENKPCNGEGTGEYQLIELDPTKRTLTEGTTREVIDTLPVREKSDGSSSSSSGEVSGDFEIPEIRDSYNPDQYFKNNIPGNDSLQERLQTMIYGDWPKDEFERLLYGEYQDRSVNELQLRSYVAWWFCGDRRMVQWFFEEHLQQYRSRDSTTKYEENEYHKRDILDFDSYVNPPYYSTEVSFELRKQTAKEIYEEEHITVNELHGSLYYSKGTELGIYSKRQIQNCLHLLEKQGLIERVSNTGWENEQIDKNYLDKLRELIEEYDHNVPQVEHYGIRNNE